ncbi:MAG: calcium-binding protein [Acetobacteraceae bacterium]|nr:calcium-binding protein [Acetobacteraceae bacterium]
MSGVFVDLGAGNDTGSGTEFSDTILGNIGNDTFGGFGGNDSLLGGDNDDFINGGNGDDTIYGGTGNDLLLAGTGNDRVFGEGGNDSFLADSTAGGPFAVYFDGGAGDDVFRLYGSADTVIGGAGTDRVEFLAGNQTIDLADLGSDQASGIDHIVLAGTNQALQLSAADVLRLTDSGSLRVSGVTGNSIDLTAPGWTAVTSGGGFTTFTNGTATLLVADNLLGSGEAGQTLSGTEGNDVISLGAGSDSYLGLGGNDSVLGNDGNDTILGGNGGDTVHGSAGDDSVSGGNNDDRLFGGLGNDSIDGGNGSDVADYSGNFSNQAVSVNLLDGRANDGLGGTDRLISIENIWGGLGNDTIIGGNGADFLWGNSGSDTLLGGNGADTLDGGSGDDTIAGGDGSDRIFGGTGSDSIDAGTGTSDIISFNHTSAQAVSATISAIGGSGGSNYAVVNSASQGNDTIINFENIQGSFENDGFTINSAATDNALLFVFGSIGADTIAVNIASNAVMADYNTITGSTNFTRGVIVDLLAGTADDGRGGIDSLIGVRGVSGSSFGDTILGSVFNDRFREQGGSDSINGRDGFDMLDYSGNNAGQSVSVNLAAERASDGREGTDTVISMENVRSGSGNDTLIGNAADNELRGGSGADILDGGASGFDIADYANNTSAQAISVNLSTGRASDGFDFIDTLSGIEYVRGGSGNDTMIGSGANERFRGNAGNDTIDGGDGTEDILDLSQTTQSVSANLVTGLANDGLDGTDRFINVEVVYSGTANDILLGSDRNEIFDGGMGSDLIDGGLGADRVRYWNVAGRNSAITRGVSVDLAAERATDGWGGQDTLIGIERVTATDFADTLLGDNVGNRFNGRAGNDSIDGGLSIDWLEYLDEDATSGITVNLTTGTASDGRGGTDIFTSIENVSGQDFADHLTGIAQLGRSTSRLRGGGGNDTLVGMANEFVTADYTDQTMGLSVNLASGSVNDGLGGVDQLINIRGAIMFGNFADTIIGTAGNDWLSPSGGNDTVSGGDGLDIISYDGNPTSGVSVNLAAGRASDGDGGTDSLSGIEGIWVSYSNDTVIGDGQGNLIGLGAGADSADAAAGQDTISYSLGFSPNTSVYVFNEAQNQLSFTGVTIDLAAGRATDFGGATDTILNFEAAIGSTMHDSILGSNGNDVLGGAEGNDTINGGGGGDTIYAGAGDVILGGAGDDVVLVGNVTLAEINALFAQWQP